MEVTPKQLTHLLTKAIKAQLPILVTGAPGIGKSDVVAQAAKDAKADMILSHPVVSDPTDAKGLPWAVEGATEATFLPFGELARALKATKPTVWFLDDLGQASPAVQASFMQLILARRVNGHKLPDCVTFVAATNRRTDRAGVSGILEPVKSRFASIVELKPDLNEWCEWALDHDIPSELVAFLRLKTELLCDFSPSADLTNCPLPRTWANVAKLMSLDLDPALELVAIAGAVGEGAAAELVAFMRLIKNLPDIDEIIANPDDAEFPASPATMYAVVTALGSRSSVKTFPGIARYAERLVEAGKGEFAVLLARDSIRRCPAVTSTATFVKLATGEFADLLTGGQ